LTINREAGDTGLWCIQSSSKILDFVLVHALILVLGVIVLRLALTFLRDEDDGTTGRVSLVEVAIVLRPEVEAFKHLDWVALVGVANCFLNRLLDHGRIPIVGWLVGSHHLKVRPSGKLRFL
jgi:hypothetical protein